MKGTSHLNDVSKSRREPIQYGIDCVRSACDLLSFTYTYLGYEFKVRVLRH